MKKALIFLLCFTMTLCLFSCGGDEKKDDSSEGYEIAMITDVGTIDDKSFNQGTWEGLKAYAEKNGYTYKYYQPTEDSTDARLEQIDLAVKNGAKIIATPGFLFEEAIYVAQDKYPDVDFVLIDGNPHDADAKDYKTGENTVAITFAEQEAGYLAGYAVVKDGYKEIGFMGGQAVPAVIRYGYGYLQGANDAAKEMGIKVNVKFNYTNSFAASPDIKTKAAGWYSAGTEVIFACGGSIFDSISAAAEEADGKVIGVDVDQSSQSKTVITSAMKDLAVAVQDSLEAFFNGEFPGGENQVLGSAQDAVGLPMDTSEFKAFSKDEYDALFEQLKAGKIDIPTDGSAKTVEGLKLNSLKITLVE